MTAVDLPLEAGDRGSGTTPGPGARLSAVLSSSPTTTAGALTAAAGGFTHTLHEGEGGNVVRRTVLPCGTRVLTERMPAQRAVTVGFWVGVGSRDEQPGRLGSTHFLEHLLFKGTTRRSALQIAEAFDEVGGESNAATAKEHTCYYARVLAEDLPMSIDVITDMVTSAVLDPEELERERGVILEELAMDKDDPEDVAFEEFTQRVLGDHPLGRPIGGTPEEILAVPRDAVLEHYRRHYRPEGLVVTAAGGLEHDVVVALVAEALGRAGWDPSAPAAPVARRVRTPAPLVPEWGEHFLERPVEQTNVLVGRPGIVAGDERRFAMTVLNAALGGGMSSRLFQEIREKRGLAYSTFSFSGAYSDAGYFGMYAGCLPARTDEVVALMTGGLETLAADGIGADELRKVVGQLGGGTVLALEDTGSRMSRLGSAELKSGEFLDIDESLDRVRSVTPEQVRELAGWLAEGPVVTTIVAPSRR
ncbi:zinc protease [Kocuria sp. CNJ-770]|uniref:M16 family metallopeptidase n=1 Tax=Kocuria sp. CNJ-770 TaxID=1904964 RepID=UPI00095B7B26|nr:pitrilysin family protein [Kocuria sp. CNJ-770]OLT13180.1 zinc protease [Kocuria sp. CNJ-770]